MNRHDPLMAGDGIEISSMDAPYGFTVPTDINGLALPLSHVTMVHGTIRSQFVKVRKNFSVLLCNKKYCYKVLAN